MVGVTKFDGLTDMALLEYCIREELNATAPRFLAVLDPLKVTIVNYPESGVEPLDAINNPEDPAAGSRKLTFGRELWIERSDFMLEPVKGYFRLAPGREVRLRYGYFIRCEEVVTDDAGNVIELKCSFDPAPGAAVRRTDAKSRELFTGSQRKPRFPPGSGSMTGSSPSNSPAPTGTTS